MAAKKTWRTWTAKEVERLETLRLEGATAAAAAAALGRTLPAVKNRIHHEGFGRTRLRLTAWLRAFDRPHTIAGVAAAMGVTKWAVKQAKRKLRRAGFDVPAAVGDHHGNRPRPPATPSPGAPDR